MINVWIPVWKKHIVYSGRPVISDKCLVLPEGQLIFNRHGNNDNNIRKHTVPLCFLCTWKTVFCPQ